MRHIHADGDADCHGDARGERLLPVRGEHLFSAERWRVSHGLQSGASGGVPERGYLRDIHTGGRDGDGDTDTHADTHPHRSDGDAHGDPRRQ